MKTAMANTSIEVFNREIKGKTNKQNEIVLSVMRRLGRAQTAKYIQAKTHLFTEDQEDLELAAVTRVLHDLKRLKKIDHMDVKEKLEDGTEGRKCHHHFIVEEGKQGELF